MKSHLLWGVFVTVVISLSCNMPTRPTSWTNITSVMVSPSVGEKDFSLEVKYSFVWDRETSNAEIYCTYASPGGSIVPIGTIVPAGLDRDREAFSKTEILPFSIKPVNGQVEPGTYVASCATEHDRSSVSSTFTVTGSATPTAEPPVPIPTPTPTIVNTPTFQYSRKGKILFDYTGYQSSRPSGGGELDWVTQWCIPEVRIAADGTLSGDCEYSGQTSHLESASVTAQVTGSVDPSGGIRFSYDVSEIGDPNGTWRISYEGQGQFTSLTQASGMAQFSFSCNSGAENLFWCFHQTSESFSGTLPWNFAPSP